MIIIPRDAIEHFRCMSGNEKVLCSSCVCLGVAKHYRPWYNNDYLEYVCKAGVIPKGACCGITQKEGCPSYVPMKNEAAQEKRLRVEAEKLG